MIIVKLLRPDEWESFQNSGEFHGSPDDLRDGFIHLSTPEQAPQTAAKWFANVQGLFAISLDSDQLGPDLRWETSRNGQLFPHYYNILKLEHIFLSEVFKP